MSARLVKVSDELAALADQCHEPARADEPYRRALRVIHARLTATATEILDRQPEHELDLGLDRYQSPAELLADLDVVDASLRGNGSAVLADDRLARLREAVHVFGFHLSGLDMRQNSEVHEEVVAELLAWAGVHPDYASLAEPDRVEVLAAEVAIRRPLIGQGAELSELARKELDIVASAARAVKVFGPAAVPNYVISMCQSVSDMLEAAVLLKEVGLLDASRGSGPISMRPWGSCRCSRPSTICSAARRFSKRCWTSRCTARWCRPGATARKSCSDTPTRTRTAGIWPPTGRCTAPSSIWSSRPARPESGCGSSTAAAAPSAAAADPATTPSCAQPPGAVNGSLRITEQGEVIAAKYAEPQHGPPQPGDAVGRDSGVHAARRRRARRRRGTRVRGARRSGRPCAARVLRIGPRDTGIRRVLQGVDAGQRDRRAQHRQSADVAQAHDVDLRPARDPVGAGLEPVAGDAARLVRHRHGVRGVDRRGRTEQAGSRCCRTCTSGGRSSAPCSRTWRR